MRTTAERLAAAKRRARELERERQRRRARGILCAGTAACLVVIVSLALVMPGITEGFSDTALGGGMAASIFSVFLYGVRFDSCTEDLFWWSGYFGW